MSVPSAEKPRVLHTQMIPFLALPQLLPVHLVMGRGVERVGQRVNCPHWRWAMTVG